MTVIAPSLTPLPQHTLMTRQSGAYRKASVALFLAGFATFSLVYCAQALLPNFVQAFGVTPAQSALSLSLTTACLAVSIFVLSAVSSELDRRKVMFVSMGGASFLSVLLAFIPSWPTLLAVRALEGFVLGGVPAVAMAYLAEETEPRDLGRAMGLYVAGTAFGGMAGRLGIGALTDLAGWRTALGLIGLVCLLATVGFRLLLPAPQRLPVRRRQGLKDDVQAWKTHLASSQLRWLFLTGFLNQGVYVAVFNSLGFHLMQAPFHFTQAQVGLVFVVNLCGMVTSTVAGRLADRHGRSRLLVVGSLISLSGLALVLVPRTPILMLGLVAINVGFFVSHTVASGWVGALAARNKGHATSLYLLTYYFGSAVIGLLGGLAWSAGGWTALIGVFVSGLAVALIVALRGEQRPPQVARWGKLM